MIRREVGFTWQLRQVMAQHGLYSTTDLHPLLVERGVELSAAQVYRLVTQPPERLNMRVLAAICDALDCTPNDLIETTAQVRSDKRAAGDLTRGTSSSKARGSRPTRVNIVDSNT